MAIATPESYAEMLKKAKEGGYAFPAINCTSTETINAVLKGLADAESDGIVQFSTGGSKFGSGLHVQSMEAGAVALAEYTTRMASTTELPLLYTPITAPRTLLTVSFVPSWQYPLSA